MGPGSPPSASPNGDDIDPFNIFVNYLPPHFTDSNLHSLFAGFGPIESAKVMLDSKKGTSLGFGFVRFSTPDAVTRAIKDMHRCRLDNKTLLVKHSNIPRTKDYFPSCETLFIRGLSRHTTPESITSFCSQIEPPSLVRVSNDFGSSRTESCVAYVRFNSIEAANRVRTALNHTLFPGSFTPIEIAFAKRNLLDHPPKPSKSHKLTPRQKKSAFPAKQKSTPRPFQFPPSNVPELSLHSEPPLPPDLPLTWRSPSTGSFLDPLPLPPPPTRNPPAIPTTQIHSPPNPDTFRSSPRNPRTVYTPPPVLYRPIDISDLNRPVPKLITTADRQPSTQSMFSHHLDSPLPSSLFHPPSDSILSSTDIHSSLSAFTNSFSNPLAPQTSSISSVDDLPSHSFVSERPPSVSFLDSHTFSPFNTNPRQDAFSASIHDTQPPGPSQAPFWSDSLFRDSFTQDTLSFPHPLSVESLHLPMTDQWHFSSASAPLPGMSQAFQSVLEQNELSKKLEQIAYQNEGEGLIELNDGPDSGDEDILPSTADSS